MTGNKKFAVIGAGYVGMSISTLLSQFNEVIVVDIDKKKVEEINKKNSTVVDSEITSFLETKDLNLKATLVFEDAIINADYVIVATPTNYDTETKFFDTSSVVESIDRILTINNSATIIIKSTVPVGFTETQKRLHNNNNIIFSPEFLREGSALYDNLNPSRVIIGGKKSIKLQEFTEILYGCSDKKDYETLFMPSTEAESVKLFSNTYLAMRVAYFNELDNFALFNNLDAKMIIDGISLDQRIGNYYNNPSFGYGGYCLPKDTKQLLSNYKDVNQNLIEAIIESNETRKVFLANMIIEKSPKSVGIYRLAMKEGSDNFRESSIIDVMLLIEPNVKEIYIYEPMLNGESIYGCKVIEDLNDFKNRCDLIITNRNDSALNDINQKVFSRDIYNNN